MKTFFLLLGAVALVAACDRRAAAPPTAAAARALTGVVEVRLGDVTQRFDLRVDRVPSGFLPALHPLAGGGAGGLGPMGAGLAAFPFVRDDGGSTPVASEPPPVTIATPGGTITAQLTYRTLGPWRVLDHAVLSAGGSPSTDLRVALLDARLER
jgi:hypothetical protein